MNAKEVNFKSEYFNIIEIAEGVYAVLEKGIGKTGSNAGIIDLGKHTVIFDTFLNMDAAKDLKKASIELTGKEPSYIINSHSHGDHIVGNQLFKDKGILMSSPQVRDELIKFKNELKAEKSMYIDRVKELEEALIKEKDEGAIMNLKNELFFLSNFSRPELDIWIPEITFEDEIILYGTKRNLQLKTFDIGHSKGDAIAYIPEEKIYFMGDLLFAKSHPWLGHGNPEEFLTILRDISKKDIKYFVPGHGPLATIEDVYLEIKYIEELLELVEKNNYSEEKQYSLDEISPEFREWRTLSFNWNIQFLIERNKEANNKSKCIDF
ncbi:MBL fold metallo-hydrolase [Clostridium sp. D2Q-11]|uniref:MBL fold metallo-hydrolase n=1 Tax=Anaeromonas frigoriresistens TaxID=2683708 RepID=A0A942UTM3_9FIRM|nr:MBL fold metallo-hydrolase [Anaeromonas frigoriresistens]MBS4538923.1 MBL fold metallo-hydrolase [Anaeromonas frigoriresistens]